MGRAGGNFAATHGPRAGGGRGGQKGGGRGGELSELTGVNPSTISRLLGTLMARGFVERDDATEGVEAAS